MQTCDQPATYKKSLQTKGFHVQLAFARASRAHVVQRKCLTASDGSCVIVRYFFITWESAALLNTSKVARHQVLRGSSGEESLNKSGGTAIPQPPPGRHRRRRRRLHRQ